MTAYILRRLGALLISLWGVSLLLFLMTHLIPGNPARAMLGERANAEAVAKLERELGLDRPLYEQYGRFLANAARLDFGRSIKTKRPVAQELWARFPATLELTMCAMVFAVVLGLLLGALSAARRGGALDFFSMTISLAGVSIPIYCLGLLLILLFANGLEWLPNGGRHSDAYAIAGAGLIGSLLKGDLGAFRDAAVHLILPTVTLGAVPLAIISRMTRSSLLEALGQDYVRTAEAKGLRPSVVLFKHALRNALIPVLTITGLEFGYLLGGAVMTESIFSWPGVGRWLWLSVLARDLPAIQGGVLFVALLFMTIVLIMDLLYAAVDPRIRAAA
ncbi:MAG: ABC transporter permease [Candidatus Poribacteria bacterium]|nr:ABC transporter permease [Candidatus Poribacteria bacterium]